jgi:UDP-3-O-[3-hydroxymyristoyl] glucosamine N-acyltransferase
LAYAKATRFFDPFPSKHEAFIHSSAIVANSATIGENVFIGANTVIEENAVIGDGTQIGVGCFIGQDSVIGKHGLLHSSISIYHGIDIGDQVILHSNVVIGSDGFGFAPSDDGWVKIHQIGGVKIGQNVEIGSSAVIDRGALGDTLIADGVKLDNHVHIAHNVSIGKNTAIAALCGIAGSTKIGANCTVAGMVGFAGHITIADNSHFTGKTMVTSSVTEPGVYSSGVPFQPAKMWRKNAIRFGKLDQYVRQLQQLTKKFND